MQEIENIEPAIWGLLFICQLQSDPSAINIWNCPPSSRVLFMNFSINLRFDEVTSRLSFGKCARASRHTLIIPPIFAILAAIAAPASARSATDSTGVETQPMAQMAPMPPMESTTAPSSTTDRPQGAACTPEQILPPFAKYCMPTATKPRVTLTLIINQFVVGSTTSGPRGQSRVTGPGSLMLMYEDNLSPRNTLRIDLMGSAEQATVGKIGTPQLLQSENLDAMHAHDTIMALEFRDTVKLGTSENQELTFLFAPRGAAAIGPVPYMHRPSAEGNPDSPLGHNLQDGFHDVSTVFGIGIRSRRTFIEATRFSGKAVSWPLPLHQSDSFGVRVTQGIDDHSDVGVSYADVLTPDDTGGAQHERFASAWLASNYKTSGGTFKSSLIWGQLRSSGHAAQNSFLAEAVLQRRLSNIFTRAEILQTTPEQLALIQFTGSARSRWVEAITLGYERALLKRGSFSLFAGGSLTKDFVTRSFESDYGARLGGAKLFIRLKLDTARGTMDRM